MTRIGRIHADLKERGADPRITRIAGLKGFAARVLRQCNDTAGEMVAAPGRERSAAFPGGDGCRSPPSSVPRASSAPRGHPKTGATMIPICQRYHATAGGQMLPKKVIEPAGKGPK